ncbi:MAG: TatD family nuclease-associated radical SAM protein [Candidatus Fermentibacteraceae bacterium]|nr:TatD family nuclease-associated radical SAM protein [Candidatus Fermentibacteraceae bacterium]
MVPGISSDISRKAAELSGYQGIYAAAGIHPNEADIDSIDMLPDIVRTVLYPGVLAVGETGLDFFHKRVSHSLQIELFEKHIHLAAIFGLTLIVHSRDAEETVLAVLGDNPGVPVIMHCYTGPDEIAQEAADRGFFIGFAGTLTYRQNDRLRRLAASLPKEQVLVETDAPYLAPEPVRGERNEPCYVVHIAKVLADLWNMDMLSASKTLLDNSLRAFQLAPVPRTDLVYMLYNRIYMNITGRCTNHCLFCIRDRTDSLGGYYLKHHEEPSEKRLKDIVCMLQPEWAEEIVFCGYGEPTMRSELLSTLANTASEKGFSVRLNTNGLCLERLSPEETLRLLEPFNDVSVSLNAPDMEEYNALCVPDSDSAWDNLLEFIQLSRKICRTRLTAVRYPGADMETVTAYAEKLNLPLRIRG